MQADSAPHIAVGKPRKTSARLKYWLGWETYGLGGWIDEEKVEMGAEERAVRGWYRIPPVGLKQCSRVRELGRPGGRDIMMRSKRSNFDCRQYITGEWDRNNEIGAPSRAFARESAT